MSPRNPSSSWQSERPWTLLLDALAAMSAPLVCRIGGLFFQAASAAYSIHRDHVTVTDRFSLLGRAVTLIAFAWSDDEDDEWFVDLEDEYCGVPVRLYHIPDEGGVGHKRWYRVSSSVRALSLSFGQTPLLTSVRQQADDAVDD